MIVCKSESELRHMREAGQTVASTHRFKAQAVKSAFAAGQLDEIAEAYNRSQGAVPSFKGYNGFPASICASVNNELVHGFPGSRKLKGDMISIGVGGRHIRALKGKWTVVTEEGSWCAHVEPSVAVTENGFAALTAMPRAV